MLPRFEVVEVTVGGRRHYLAYDHLDKSARHPVDSRSKVQAFGLVETLAMTARSNGEPLSVEREDTPPVKQS